MKPKASCLARKVRKMLAAKDRGRAGYIESDQILDELLAELKPGQQLDLGGGQIFEVIDNFAVKNKCFKPAGVCRFEGKITRT